MTPSDAERLRDIESIIAANAVRLRQAVTVGVHRLGDGRVRIYDLSVGWRTKPYREYRNLDAALNAARTAERRAMAVDALVDSGWTVSDAVSTVAR